MNITTDAAIDGNIAETGVGLLKPVGYNHVPLADGGRSLETSPELLLHKDGRRFAHSLNGSASSADQCSVRSRQSSAGVRRILHEHELLEAQTMKNFADRVIELHIPSSPQ